MAFYALGGAEMGPITGITSPSYGIWGNRTGGAVQSGTVLDGVYSYQVDPVNGAPVVETYGFSAPLDQPKILSVMFNWRFAAGFDEAVVVSELGVRSTGGNASRLLVLSTDQRLRLVDEDGDTIEETAANYVLTNTQYGILWYLDKRDDARTRDMLWVWKPAASVGPVTDIAFVDGGAGADTITQVAAGFGVFSAGDSIVVSGSVSNDGTYTIVSVVAGTITLATGTLTAESAGASVTISHTAQWYTALDTPDWGDAVTDIEQVAMGSNLGKGLPTSGGPMIYDSHGLQVLNQWPHIAPVGSVEIKYRAPNTNGTDGDFDTGSGGGGHPDYQLVDEIPEDGDTTYDAGDVAGDQQSYALANAAGGDAVLALAPIGVAKRTGSGTNAKLYVTDGSTREYSGSRSVQSAYDGVTVLHSGIVWDKFGAVAMSEALFNSLEVGIEINTIASGEARLTQIGVEYAIEGPLALPSDFPDLIEIGSGSEEQSNVARY